MQKLLVDVYSPPKLELPPDVKGIIVSSRFVPAEGEYEAVQWGYFESVDTALWNLSKYYTEQYAQYIDSSDRYMAKADFKPRMLRNNNDTIPEILPWKGMANILQETGAAGFAVLEGFGISEGEVDMNEGQGSEFIASKSVSVKAAWRIVQPERRRLLDENIYTFTKIFTGSGTTKDEALSSLPGNEEMKKQACDYAAAEYAKLIIPGFDSVEREYYKDGDIKLEEAHAAILEGNWSKAESKWNYLSYKSENDEVRAMASYNMAMICEMDGRLNQALGFARKANKYMPNNRHIELINDLTIKMFKEEEKRKNKEVIRNW